MINTLKKHKLSAMEKELRAMLSSLNNETQSKQGLQLDPHFWRGYITIIHEILGEPIDKTKYFGVFNEEKNDNSITKRRRKNRNPNP